jgi:hypothetical protein
MNVALLHPAARLIGDPVEPELRHETAGPTSEWIDPEGDDWFSEIYRELAALDSGSTDASRSSTDLEHWFG